ncbi:MAG: tyrosine-type recombinase/integrase [Azoarcus sp.]|nr:tyrosine-type recombinase/integrase [Azoarcus sp.]
MTFKNKIRYSLLSYRHIAGFYQSLRSQSEVGAKALALMILTGRRVSEVLNAQWAEIDFAQRVWNIPAARMKNRQAHRVPLLESMQEILGPLRGLDPVWVFPGARGGALSKIAVSTVLRKMGHPYAIVYDFHAIFRAWVDDKATYPEKLVALAFARWEGHAFEMAYRRSDLFERHRALMQDWASWCSTPQSNEKVEGHHFLGDMCPDAGCALAPDVQ